MSGIRKSGDEMDEAVQDWSPEISVHSLQLSEDKDMRLHYSSLDGNDGQNWSRRPGPAHPFRSPPNLSEQRPDLEPPRSLIKTVKTVRSTRPAFAKTNSRPTGEMEHEGSSDPTSSSAAGDEERKARQRTPRPYIQPYRPPSLRNNVMSTQTKEEHTGRTPQPEPTVPRECETSTAEQAQSRELKKWPSQSRGTQYETNHDKLPVLRESRMREQIPSRKESQEQSRFLGFDDNRSKHSDEDEDVSFYFSPIKYMQSNLMKYGPRMRSPYNSANSASRPVLRSFSAPPTLRTTPPQPDSYLQRPPSSVRMPLTVIINNAHPAGQLTPPATPLRGSQAAVQPNDPTGVSARSPVRKYDWSPPPVCDASECEICALAQSQCEICTPAQIQCEICALAQASSTGCLICDSCAICAAAQQQQQPPLPWVQGIPPSDYLQPVNVAYPPVPVFPRPLFPPPQFVPMPPPPPQEIRLVYVTPMMPAAVPRPMTHLRSNISPGNRMLAHARPINNNIRPMQPRRLAGGGVRYPQQRAYRGGRMRGNPRWRY